MADKTIEWLHAIRAQDAGKPFFGYFSTGCSHAPHHVSEAWAEKYRGKFDQGWDRLREETFARQQALGVIPADAELTPRDEAFPAWDDVPDKLKAYYARQMEVYAGYSENADYNVGRVLDAIEELGELDNTLVLWIWGDNGASMEGTITGSFNELTMQNGIPLTDEMQLQLAERYGGVEAWGNQMMAPHYSAAWAWAGNTPFQWGKQVGSHLGGTRNPLVVHWPERISEQGALRSHFTHVIDIGPTILDIAGIPMPTHIDGIEQQPMHGVTFADSFTDGGAPERHTQQYFETIGNRAMYKDGWWLAMKTERIPWVITPDALKPYTPGVWNPDDDPVELYYLPDDFSQAHDLAAEHPEKVEELKKLFWEEAEKYNVLPLLATLAPFFGIVPPLPEIAKYEFRGDVQNVLSGMIPRVYNHSYTISADLVIPPGGAEGVIVAEADHLGGFSLFVDEGKLTHTYSMMGVFVFRQQAEEPLPEGEVNVRMEFAADAAKPATGGEVTLFIDDRPVGGGRMDHTVPIRFSGYAGMDIGRDNGGVVDLSYESRKPFAFTGEHQEGRVRRQSAPVGGGGARAPHGRPTRAHGARDHGVRQRPTRGGSDEAARHDRRPDRRLPVQGRRRGGLQRRPRFRRAPAGRGGRQQGPRGQPVGRADRPHGARGGRGPRRRRVRRRPVRAAAARRDRHRRGARRGRRQARCTSKTSDKLGEQAGDTIPLGGAGLIVAYSTLRSREGRTRRDARRAEGGRRGRGEPRPGPEGRARRRPAEDGRRQLTLGEFPRLRGFPGWARLGSNQRPLACEARRASRALRRGFRSRSDSPRIGLADLCVAMRVDCSRSVRLLGTSARSARAILRRGVPRHDRGTLRPAAVRGLLIRR